MKLLGAEQLCGIARSDQGKGVIRELRPVTFDGGKLSGGKPPDLDDERRRRRKGAERIGVRDAEDLVWGLTVYASFTKGRCDMSHDLSHPAARHRDVVQRRAVRADCGYDCRGSLVNGDVVGMPVEAIFAEGNHHVWTKQADCAADVGFELPRLNPGQHAILVVE
jgi:hypothetical protein